MDEHPSPMLPGSHDCVDGEAVEFPKQKGYFTVVSSTSHCGSVLSGDPEKRTGTEDFFSVLAFSMFLI